MNTSKNIRMVIAGTLMLLFLGIIYAWSIFRVEIKAMFPEFSAAQLSLTFTITMTCFCLGGFIGGKLSAKFSQRISVRLSAVMLFIGLMSASFMGEMNGAGALLLLYICYGAVCGLGTGIGYNACVSGVSPWFPKRLGLISGILLMGFGFGSLFLGLLAKALSVSFGVFAVFRIYAVVILLVLFTGSFFLKKPERQKKADTLQGVRKSYTSLQMLAQGSFWVYFVWNIILSSSGMLIINSAANISSYFGAAAALGLVVSVFNGVGRPVTGAVMDKLGQFNGMTTMNGLLIMASLFLIYTAISPNVITMCIGMFIVGMCYGGGVTISAKVINDVYGPEHYAVNFSLANFCMIPASFIGPYISGILQDNSGGSYTSTFIMLLGMSLFALIVLFLLRLILQKESAKESNSNA